MTDARRSTPVDDAKERNTMTLRTMDDVRRELRRLLDELKGKGTPRPHQPSKNAIYFCS
jgi:hypothetical protein